MNICYQELKRKREEKEYTYEEMAKKLEISKSFYWQLENKRRRLYYEMAKRIAAIFELKPDDIFYES